VTAQPSSMLTPEIICATFAAGPNVNEPRNPYHGKYTSILCTAFIQFLSSLKFLDHNLDEMTVLHPTTEKPVFIFLIAPENTPATSGHAEDTMLKLLKEVDVPGIKVVHGVCVCGSRAAFYEYDCERRLVSPTPQGQVHYDWDLATHSGAVHFIQVPLSRCTRSSLTISTLKFDRHFVIRYYSSHSS
jgi:hypothetical protein